MSRKRICDSADNPRELFPSTTRGDAALARFNAQSPEFGADEKLVLLAVMVMACETPAPRFEMANLDLAWETGLPWHRTLMITRWMIREGILRLGERVDYFLRKDAYWVTYLDGIP